MPPLPPRPSRAEDAPLAREDLSAFVADVLRMSDAERFVDAALKDMDDGVVNGESGCTRALAPQPCTCHPRVCTHAADGSMPVASFVAFTPLLAKRVTAALAPGSVSALASIAFVPREDVPPTRSVGSWVGVCVASGMLMVNAWVQSITGDLGVDFPNSSELTLRDFTSMTDRTYGGVPTSDAECE